MSLYDLVRTLYIRIAPFVLFLGRKGGREGGWVGGWGGVGRGGEGT